MKLMKHAILGMMLTAYLMICGCWNSESVSDDGVITIVNQIRPEHKHVMYDVFFGPNNESVISCANDIRKFSCPDLKELAVEESPDIVFDTAVARDRESFICVYSKDYYEIRKSLDLQPINKVMVKSLSPETSKTTGERFETSLDKIVISNDNHLLLMGDDDELSVWDMSENKEIFKAELPENEHSVYSLAISDNNKIAAFATSNSTVLIYDIASQKLINSFHASRIENYYAPSCMVFTQDDHYLLTGSNDHEIIIWDWKNGKIAWDWQDGRLDGVLTGGHRATVENMKFFPDGRHLASTGSDGFLCIWDMQTRKLLAKKEVANEWTYGLDISDDGKMIVTGGACITLLKIDLSKAGK